MVQTTERWGIAWEPNRLTRDFAMGMFACAALAAVLLLATASLLGLKDEAPRVIAFWLAVALLASIGIGTWLWYLSMRHRPAKVHGVVFASDQTLCGELQLVRNSEAAGGNSPASGMLIETTSTTRAFPFGSGHLELHVKRFRGRPSRLTGVVWHCGEKQQLCVSGEVGRLWLIAGAECRPIPRDEGAAADAIAQASVRNPDATQIALHIHGASRTEADVVVMLFAPLLYLVYTMTRFSRAQTPGAQRIAEQNDWEVYVR